MDNNLNTPQTVPHQSNPIGKVLLIVLVLGLIAAAGAGGYFAGTNNMGNQALQTNEPELKAEQKTEDSLTPLKDVQMKAIDEKKTSKWKKASDLASFSFEYPYGWHVASRWPEDYSKPIAIWMDTDPINGAPRGGPFAKIEMSALSGIPDAEKQFNKTKEDIKKNYESVVEEVINSEAGTIYHYTGKVPPGYLGGAILDEYVLKLEGPDDINDNIITIVTYDKPDLKDTLRYIALSIKKK